jgi:hypothetical protein
MIQGVLLKRLHFGFFKHMIGDIHVFRFNKRDPEFDSLAG